MLLTYIDGRTGLMTTDFRYKLTTADGTLVKDWTTGVAWTEAAAGVYTLADAAAVPGTRYLVEPSAGVVGGVGVVPYVPLQAEDYVPPSGPVTGVTITPATRVDATGVIVASPLGTALGRVMPYGKIIAYLNNVAQDEFDADADGDYSFQLPTGSVWRLVASNPPLYKTTTMEVSTIPTA